jgi:hypothetical protein
MQTLEQALSPLVQLLALRPACPLPSPSSLSIASLRLYSPRFAPHQHNARQVRPHVSITP